MPGEDILQQTIRSRAQRFTAAGVDPNDLEEILGRIVRWDQWCDSWVRAAAVHEELGETALQEGNLVTAGEAFVCASLYYHFGQFLTFEDRDAKQHVQRRKVSAYRKAMPHLRPPALRLDIPFEDILIPGNLRVPEGRSAAPCVLLTPGADSTKEEFYTLENAFLAREVATFSYDGPGQGETWLQMKLRPDYERAVTAVLDNVGRRDEIDSARLGIWGRSLGGYLAPRAAAFDGRLGACITVGGLYDLSSRWDSYPQSLKDTLRFNWDAPTEAAARECARAYTLAGVLGRVTCPLLIIHSGKDPFFNADDAERMRREAGGPTNLVVFPEGTHACDNIPYKVRPLIADWMACQLGRGP